MGKFLDQWYSASTSTEETFDADAFAQERMKQLTHALLMGHFAMSIPRRLGGDATPDELADDKRFSKTLRNRLLSSLRQWDSEAELTLDDVLEDTPDGLLEAARVAGAQVDWHAWFKSFAKDGRKQLSILAAYATEGKVNAKLANSYGQRIYNELNVVNAIYEQILASD
jgi:hypothetical protein